MSSRRKIDVQTIKDEVNFLEGLLVDLPDDIDILESLALDYTDISDYKKGLKMDLRIVKLKPTDPIARYNLACSYALTFNFEDSVKTLKQSILMGYKDFSYIEQDPDLETLRSLPIYQEIIDLINNESK